MFSLKSFVPCLLALSFFNVASAVPLERRQATSTSTAVLAGVTSVMEISDIEGPSGPATQTCIITLTPIDNGSEVQEVKNCTISTDGSGSGAAAGSSASEATTASATTASAVSSNAAISVIGISSTTSLFPSTPTGSSSVSSDSASASATSAAASSASPSVSASASSSASPTTSTSTAGSANDASESSSVSGNVATAAADNDPAATATASLSSVLIASSYSVPGRSIQVFPIGLGVFCGITALALIVVALVTFERTKYRKAFRQRKLAEQGAQMGYSR